MRRVIDWFKWEFDRRIEVTPVIRFITVERFVKATVLILGGVILLVAGATTDIHRLAEEFQTQYNLSPGRGWWRHVYETTLVHLGNMPRRKEDAIAVGAIAYGALECWEGVGLLLRRRWAEYLVLVATAAFLPLEITEIAHKPTVFKVLALLVNLLIIAYLIWRKRLFLERPSHERADRTAPPPAELTGKHSGSVPASGRSGKR